MRTGSLLYVYVCINELNKFGLYLCECRGGGEWRNYGRRKRKEKVASLKEDEFCDLSKVELNDK